MGKTSRWAIALLCCAPAAPLGAQETTRTAAPVLLRADGLDQSNGALRLSYACRQEAGRPLAVEAERATLLRFTPGKGVFGADPDAAGGRYVAYVDHLELRFTLAEAGHYVAWYRASFPWKGNWNHTESLDDGPTRTHTDSQGEVLDQWLWVRGLEYDLTAGEHTWRLAPAGWCGGTKLDRLLLVKDGGTPEGMGPAGSPATTVGGVAVTEQLQPRTLVRWQRLRLNDAGSGQVTVEATCDGSVSWQPVPADGDLSKLPAGRPLALRLTLKPDADGGTPYVTGLSVDYLARVVPPLVLQNQQAKLTFDGDSGALIGLTSPETGTECLAAGVSTPLFSFVGHRPEFHTTVEIGFGQAELRRATPGKDSLSLDYALLGGGLLVTVKVSLSGRVARFGTTVTNRSPYEIAQVRLLSPRGLRIGADCTDDKLFTPITTGCIVQNPAALEYPRRIYTDRPLAYPGMATMCWMDLWDERCGVYLACEDRLCRLTELTFSTGTGGAVRAEAEGTPPPREPEYKYAKVPGEYVNLGFDKRWRIPRGSPPVTLPEVVVGLHTGDWHWGADRYRAWSEAWMKPLKETPDWFRDEVTINDCHNIHLGNFVRLAKGRPRGARRGDLKETISSLVAMWAQQASCEAYWSTPVLHLLLGTESEFAGGVQKQHEMGHRFVSYNLPRSLNPMFNQGEKRIGCVPISLYSPDQVPPVGFYAEVGMRLADGRLTSPDGSYNEAGVCLGATKWQAYERHIILDKYLKQYGNDGMYLDGAGLDDLRTQDCRSLTHGHDTYGEWTTSFLTWLKELRAAARRARPGAVFLGEGMGDVYHTMLDAGLFYPDNAPEVFRYTCPWAIGLCMPGTSPIPDWPAGGLEYAAVYGLMIAGYNNNYEVDPERFVRYYHFRQRYHQFQSRARFADRSGVTVTDAKARAAVYLRDEPGTRGALLVAYRPDAEGARQVTIAAAATGKLRAAWWCDPEGGWRKLTVRGGPDQYSFELPPVELSACLLVERCEPLLNLGTTPIVPGETGTVPVTVTNLGGAPAKGTVTLAVPRDWRAGKADYALAAGEARTFELPCTPAAKAAFDVHDIHAVATQDGRATRRCKPIGVCRPVQAELTWVAADRLRLEMSSSSRRPVAGTARLVVPAGITAQPASAPFSLSARGEGTLEFALAGVDRVDTLQHVQARLAYGGLETVAYETLQPPVLNGGFEQDTAGDGRPDYWNYRFPEGLYFGPGMALDQDIRAEGRQALRLEPYLQDTRNHVLTTFVKLVPGHRYRLSCRIRRSENHPSVGVRLWSMYSRDGKQPVTDLWLGYQKDGPLNEWQEFSGELTAAELDVPYNLMLTNTNKSPATVWLDDLRLAEVK